MLFTRDLRVHDHPALVAACAQDVVVPLFVLDDRVDAAGFAVPNRMSVLRDGVTDLRQALRDRGNDLIVRRGDLVDVVAEVVAETGAASVHCTEDHSAFARTRQRRLRERLGDDVLELHPGHLLHPPGTITPTGGGDAFKVFTPYWRRWADEPRREPLAAPDDVPAGHDLEPGDLPVVDEDAVAPQVVRGGELAARARADEWFDGPIAAYDDGQDDVGDDNGTSRLSHHLHFGTISVAELVARSDRRRAGHDAFVRQLCWREFSHQILAAQPSLVHEDIRSRGDDWRDDPEAFDAWREGRTGYPLVDAGMRELLASGFMHNRVRMVVASFLTKHLYLDWRLGADHFARHLVDGDVANNWVNWQWVAGTGLDSRPNRIFNPITQGSRHDPSGTYIRRWVAELADVEDTALVHQPWKAADQLLDDTGGYPAPIVDHDDARQRFLAARDA